MSAGGARAGMIETMRHEVPLLIFVGFKYKSLCTAPNSLFQLENYFVILQYFWQKNNAVSGNLQQKIY